MSAGEVSSWRRPSTISRWGSDLSVSWALWCLLARPVRAFFLQVDPTGKVCLDSGLSTGGFTDCLLQRGAARVYGIDVGKYGRFPQAGSGGGRSSNLCELLAPTGYGQVAEKVRQDSRVVVMERTNLRHLRRGDLGEPIQLASLDLSFISVLKVVPALCELLAPEGSEMLVLIKPQFEAGRGQVGAGGVVKDPKVHQEVIERVTAGICGFGFRCMGVIESPIRGQKSENVEFLGHFVRDPSAAVADPTAALMTETEDQGS